MKCIFTFLQHTKTSSNLNLKRKMKRKKIVLYGSFSGAFETKSIETATEVNVQTSQGIRSPGLSFNARCSRAILRQSISIVLRLSRKATNFFFLHPQRYKIFFCFQRRSKKIVCGPNKIIL